MLTTTCSTAEASGTVRVSDEAALMSATLTVKACEAALVPFRVMAPLDTLAATPPAEQSDEASAWSSVLAAAKSIPVMLDTLPCTSWPLLAKPGRVTMVAELSVTSEPHCRPPEKLTEEPELEREIEKESRASLATRNERSSKGQAVEDVPSDDGSGSGSVAVAETSADAKADGAEVAVDGHAALSVAVEEVEGVAGTLLAEEEDVVGRS
jgi:hypothetical protein